MNRPLDPPQWATDATYIAGSKSWSLQQNKIAPSGGERQSGHVPNTQPAAQIENYDRNLTGQWLDYVRDAQALNWSAPRVVVANVAAGNTGLGLAYCTGTVTRVIVGGTEAGGAIYTSFDGRTYYAATITSGNAEVTLKTVATTASTLIAGGPPKVAGASPGGRNIHRSTDGGLNWVGNIALPTASPGATFAVHAMIRAAGLALFVVAGNDHAAATYLATSPDGASGNWTQRTLPSGTSSAIQCMVTNGSRVVAFALGGTASAWYSDDGITWNFFTPPANTIVTAAYSAETGVWMALTSAGVVYISNNGNTWNASGATLPVTPGMLAVSGSLWIASCPTAVANIPSRIVYSSNAGVNWKTCLVGSVIDAPGAISTASKALVFVPHIQSGGGGFFWFTEGGLDGSDQYTNSYESLRLGIPANLV